MNELGRRLDFDVRSGLYQGVSNGIGFDGLWHSPEKHSIIVEVKTTDAFRLSLDVIAGYRTKLLAADEVGENSSILIVVGRQDTGELEAQIRGSRHAWDVRLISAEALVKLVQMKQETELAETGRKIRSLFMPVEYTRLDNMVDVMFTTVSDVEEPSAEVEQAGLEPLASSEQSAPVRAKGVWQFTDKGELQAKRDLIVSALALREGTVFIRKSRALYWNATHDVRVACAMSKRYTAPSRIPYWFAYHPQWQSYLGESVQGFFALGCMDLDAAFVLPQHAIDQILPFLNTTTGDSETYWHLHIVSGGSDLAILLPKADRKFDLRPYRLSLVG